MRDYTLARELADKLDMTMVETTSASNGYPQNLEAAIIGFENFNDAEEFAREHGLDLMILHRRDGWRLYHRDNSAYEPFHNTAEDFGDNYLLFTADEAETFFENEVKPCLENFDNFEDVKDFIERMEEIYDNICSLDNNEAVVTYCGRYYRTIEVESMEFYHDTHEYVIGVV